ncbi:MAG: glucosamine-6-phosphate deaminase [Clostridiales bacterium]|jgi:glucosamine-6-phosphate deaminase|nr:glucosamine-6-phosphate deaminase [Clostridiales bacterium]
MSATNFATHILDDYDAMSRRASEILASIIKSKPEGVLGLATGWTPVGLYRELIRMYNNGSLDFSRLTTFNLDEYYPIKRTNPQSYYKFMQDHLFKYVNIQPERINIPNGETRDPAGECAAYEKKIQQAGGMDLLLLGIGVNGHIGFNEPSDCFPKGTHLVALSETTIESNSRFFQCNSDVPRKAISMGIRTIMFARKILIIMSGEKKAEAVSAMLNGPITSAVPASVLQLHRDVTVVMDKAAASKIA